MKSIKKNNQKNNPILLILALIYCSCCFVIGFMDIDVAYWGNLGQFGIAGDRRQYDCHFIF
jgi:hypothetical protein